LFRGGIFLQQAPGGDCRGKAFGKGCGKAFGKGCGKAFGKGCGKAFGTG
jgi:hypothetical protein